MVRILKSGIVLLLIFILPAGGCIERREEPQSIQGEVLEIFKGNTIHFDLNRPGEYETPSVKAFDNGRVIAADVDIPEMDGPVKITAHVIVHPIPKDEISVHDPWDRAGNVRLARDDMPDIEIVKFVTAYGGFTEYEVDVTHLASLLRGSCTFMGFVDTWMTPGWKMDFSLIFTPSRYIDPPVWVEGLLYEESMEWEKVKNEGITVEVDIPEGLKKVTMNYLVSGHCTDGRDADEFVSKDNVIYIDGREIHRFKPWRDDCRQFRAINPYCRRWSDGTWSSDFSRSGWCPGDKVDPVKIDMTPHLPSGKHTVRFVVEDIRPPDTNNHYGYWRVSSHLLGWTN